MKPFSRWKQKMALVLTLIVDLDEVYDLPELKMSRTRIGIAKERYPRNPRAPSTSGPRPGSAPRADERVALQNLYTVASGGAV